MDSGHGFGRGDAIRELIEIATVFREPFRPGGVTVEITGRLNALLGEQAYPNRVGGVWGKMVAEVRYIALPTMDDAVFCYWRSAA